MKKILLVTLDFYPKTGGVAEYYFNLCDGLDKVVVLTDGVKTQEKFNFKIYRKKLLSNFIWPKWFFMVFYVFKIIRQEKIDLVWVGNVLPVGTVVYILTRFLKLDYIVSCHGTDILTACKSEHKKKLASKILKQAKWVTVNSGYTRGLVEEMGVNRGKIKIIYPGVGINKLDEETHEFKNKKVLLSVGRLVKRKGFDSVIQALPGVLKKIPDLMYVIVGDGPDKDRLVKLAEGMGDKIIFKGNIQGEAKWKLYSACDVFISPGREVDGDVEGLGIVFLEAASMSKPAIAGKAGGAREAVIAGETGIIVDGENINEIAKAIIKLFEDDELRKKMGEQARKRVEAEFQWGKSADNFKNLISL